MNDLSFCCESGDFVAILGPSGCGKTTTLRMIAGLETITRGEIHINGTIINDLAPKDRGIGLAFEDYALYPPLNVFDNMAFNLRAKKMPESEVKKQVHTIAELLHVTDILYKLPRELSGGQKQRVNIARAIIRSPRILLLDEPMSHLDGKLRQVLRQEIRKLHKEIGCTTILVTHDQLEAMSLADKMVIMNLGVLQQFDSPATIFNSPENEFVAEFIGDPPMNILDADIEQIGGKKFFSFYGNKIQVPKSCEDQVKQGQTVRFGIRPDDITLSKQGDPIKITVFENLGEEKRISIHLTEDMYFMISLYDNVRYTANDTICITFNDGKVHIFNKK